MVKDSYSARKKTMPHWKSNLLIEIYFIFQISIFMFLATSLFSYSRLDPSWTHTVHTDHIENWSGRVGAWTADIVLMLFGFSAYWLIIPLCRLIVVNYNHIASYQFIQGGYKKSKNQKQIDWLSEWLPFVLILLASDGIESMRMWSLKADLPLAPGGIVGNVIARSILHTFGFSSGTIVLLIALLIGLSLYFRFSWLCIADYTGGAILFTINFIKQYIKAKYADFLYKDSSLHCTGNIKEECNVQTDDRNQVEIIEQINDPVKSNYDEKERSVPILTHLPKYSSLFPAISLLDPAPEQQESISISTLEFTSRLIEKKLNDFGVNVRVVAVYPGPVITRFEIDPATGIKGSQITGLAKDLARSLSRASIRVVETIPGKNHMALELPNQSRQPVRLSEIISSDVYQNSSSSLTLTLGKDISGYPVVTDLAKAPHILVAGTTGSGKSVGINAMILSLLYKASPEQIRLILIDPKMLELSVYEGIPHLLTPVVTDMKLAANTLNWCIEEIERRYKLMSAVGVRNITSFNEKIHDAEVTGKKISYPFSLIPETVESLPTQPFIVVIIDELADLIMVVGRKIEDKITRIAQKARAAGIHLIIATQRPSVDVITGLIKANIPTRIAFQVSSKIDSRTILDQIGAECLLGMGDMLFLPPGTGYPQRLHGAFVGDEEVHRVVDKLKKNSEPKYIEELIECSTQKL